MRRPIRRIITLFVAVSQLAFGLPAIAAEVDVGRQVSGVVRITSDNNYKEGAVISADGSTVVFTQALVGKNNYNYYTVSVVPTDGSKAPRELFRTDEATGGIIGVQGPRYTAANTNYKVAMRGQHVQLSADGSRLVMQVMEYAADSVYYSWLLVNTRTGTTKVLSEAGPSGLGVPGDAYGYHYGIRSLDAEFAVSGDGNTIVWAGKGNANNGTSYIVVAQDIATGTARRLAGYSDWTSARVGDADPPGSYGTLSVSPYGTKFSFTTYYSYTTYIYAGDFSPGSAPPTKVGTLGVGSTPRFTANGEYLASLDQSTVQSVFHAISGGTDTRVDHRDTFTRPFYDGKVGIIEVPVWASSMQEVRVARPEGAAVLLKPEERGLPTGWLFGVNGISSAYHWTLSDAAGNKVLLSMISAGGKSNDLFVLSLTGSATPPPVQPPVPPPVTPPGGVGSGTAGEASLSWTAVTGARGYAIFRTDAQGGYDWEMPLTDFPVTDTRYVDSGLTPGATCYYIIFPVTGYDAGNKQIWGEPIYLTVTASSGMSIKLKIGDTVAYVAGQVYTLDVAPFIEKGRTMVPLRFIGEQLGAQIAWEGSEQRVTYTKGSTVIQLWVGRTVALVNGQSVTLDVAPLIVNSRTVVPLRFVATQLGAHTDWNGDTQEITITP